jgi:anti-sigma factor RsiW
MTSEQARDQFSAALEADLTADDRQAFDAALAADPALADEYARFQRLLSVAKLAVTPPSSVPNLLPKVQARIRKRSRGRFYRDRFSERGGLQAMLPMVAGAVMLVVLAALWMLSSYL